MNISKNFNPYPFEYHSEIELKIDLIANLGMGVGRHNNWVVMVPFVLVGEIVKVRIYKNHTNYSEADLLEIIKPSRHRVSPKCSLFSKCGGCQYQHIDYPEQLKIKTKQVEDLLEKNGSIKHTVLMAKPSPKVYGYRTKITPHYQKPDKLGKQPIGFLAYGRRYDIVDVNNCPIATEAINNELPSIRTKAQLEGGRKRRKRGGTLLIRETLEGIATNPKDIVSEKVGSYTFQFKAGEFFQNNASIISNLVDYVKESVSVDSVDYLVDAYCGVGLFALSCSDLFKSVVGIEISEASIQLANANACIHNISNVRFKIGKAESIFYNLEFAGTSSSLIIDPPRKGCDLAFIDQVLAFRPKCIVYVSCDPSTQARDLRLFIDGGYNLIEVQPFDLFPHTRHIESVAILHKQ